MCERSKQVIPGLIRKINLLESQFGEGVEFSSDSGVEMKFKKDTGVVSLKCILILILFVCVLVLCLKCV